MYRKILVAYNGSPESKPALQECIRLEPDPSTQVHLLAVVTLMPMVIAAEFAAVVPTVEEEQVQQHAMEQVLESGRTMLAEAGLNVITHLEVGEPAQVIAELADKLDIELVIVGHSRHKSFAMRWWRGTMDAVLVEKVKCSVLIAT